MTISSFAEFLPDIEMTQYKLTYFNSRGRGEIIRYLFALAGQKYEDNRVTSEQWGKMKAGKYSFVP